jgi:DNA-binding transcriptional MerR regulator
MPKKMRMTIGEFSRFCQVTVKTLRYYDKLGLLMPN